MYFSNTSYVFRSSLFCYVTQPLLVVRLSRNVDSQLQTLCDIIEERRPNLHRGGSLKISRRYVWPAKRVWCLQDDRERAEIIETGVLSHVLTKQWLLLLALRPVSKLQDRPLLFRDSVDYWLGATWTPGVDEFDCRQGHESVLFTLNSGTQPVSYTMGAGDKVAGVWMWPLTVIYRQG